MTAHYPGPAMQEQSSDQFLVLDAAQMRTPEEFEAVGLDMTAVLEMTRTDIPAERALRNAVYGDEAAGILDTLKDDDHYRRIITTHSRHLTYLDTLLATNRALAWCPLSGRAVRADESALIDTYHIAYGFSGEERFYLIVGRWHGRKCALFLPSRKLIVLINAPEKSTAMTGMIIKSMEWLAHYKDIHPDASQSRTLSEGNGFVLTMATTANLGHQIWQDLSGLELMIDQGLADKINRIIVCNNAKFDIGALFPELPPGTVRNVGDSRNMRDAAYREHGTIIHPVGYQISQSLRERIWRVSRAEVGPVRAAEIDEAAKDRKLIWINLRSHNKSWINQIDGHVAVLEALQKEFGNIGVVYDGWTDTLEVRDAIDAKLSPDILRFNTVGCQLSESILWANVVSAYISVIGSGLVINSWLSSTPGVAHSDHVHLLQATAWPSVAPDAIPPIFLTKDQIESGVNIYSNYDFDWQHLLEPLSEILRNASSVR